LECSIIDRLFRRAHSIFKRLDLKFPSVDEFVDIELTIAKGSVDCLRANGSKIIQFLAFWV
jgi:hypothetical protein